MLSQNASVAISNWFSPSARGRAFGLLIMSGQIGGALSPLLVIPIQQAFGWRASFFVFALLGVVWSIVWFVKFRDTRSDSLDQQASAAVSWQALLRSRNLWCIMALTFGYVYSMSFYQTWLHTYLVRGRGFSENALLLSSLPYAIGAAANLAGGLSCDRLAARFGLKWSRRLVGLTGLALSALFLLSAIYVTGKAPVIFCLSIAYAGITFQQPAVFAACLDIGGSRGGAVSGFMNSAGQFGGAVASMVFGYIVKATGSYDAPLFPMAVLMFLGALLWIAVDVSRPIQEPAAQ